MANYIVTILDDVVDAGDGELSLREALTLANLNTESDTITFEQTLAGGTLTLTSGELTIGTDGITVDGDIDGNGTADSTVSGNNASRVFLISDGATTTIAAALNGLVISGGATALRGGGVYVGDADALTLTNATVSGNNAGLYGGGIAGGSNSAITLTNATVSGNSAGDFGGGIFGDYNAAITLTNATVSGNSASLFDGGGIFRADGTAITLTNATVSGNNAGRYGGGIIGVGNSAITLTNATVSGNSAAYFGGGISGGNNSAITLTNATVTGNSAGRYGGGIFSFGVNTVTTLANSIVAGNDATRLGDDLSGGSSLLSQLVFAGGNVIGSAPESFASVSGPSPTQIDGASQAALETVFATVAPDPNTGVLSGVLTDNGGPVETVALRALAAHPALDPRRHPPA